MTTLNGATDHSVQQHTRHSTSEADRCPLCGSPISAAIRARIDENCDQLAQAEQTLRDQFASERQRAVAKAAAEIACRFEQSRSVPTALWRSPTDRNGAE